MKKQLQSYDYLTSCFEKNTSFLGILLIVVFISFSLINPRVFLDLKNLQSMAFQFSELGLCAIAMCLAIIIGGIDLSIVAIANLSAVLMAILIKEFSGEVTNVSLYIILMTVLFGLCVGVICGLINGFLIGYLEIPAMLATLVTMTLFNGVAIGLTKGVTVAGIPDNFLQIGIGTLLGIPIPLIIFLLVALVVHCLLMKHKFGWSLFLIGTSMKSSYLTGIDNKKNMMLTHALIGVISAIAGIVILARTNSASAQYGVSYTLSSILIVILGGISISGGKGFFTGVIISVVFLQILSTGFNLLLQGVSGGNFFKDFVWGALLIMIIFVNKNSLIEKFSIKISKLKKR